MIVKTKVKIMKLGNSLGITLPKIIVDNYGIKKGQDIEIALLDNYIVLIQNMLPLDVRLKPNSIKTSKSPITIP